MRKLEDESYEDWLDRIDLFERGVALQRLAKGENMDIVLEDFIKLHDNNPLTIDIKRLIDNGFISLMIEILKI
jgi:hypothetical protein